MTKTSTRWWLRHDSEHIVIAASPVNRKKELLENMRTTLQRLKVAAEVRTQDDAKVAQA